MLQLLKFCIGLGLIVCQVFIGAKAFFPDLFQKDNNALEEILDKKKLIVDKVSPEDLAFLTQNTEVAVGVDPNFYPLETFDERGRYTGLGADYMRLLGKMTGLKFKPISHKDWAATEEMAKNGELDMFMAAAQTGRREDYMRFTAPYVNLPGVIMTRRDSGLDKLDLNSLKGKKVAVTRDYSWHDFLKEFHPEITPVPAENTLAALQKVTNGEADAILDYEFNLLEKIQTAGILQMQTAGQVDSNYGHAIAVRKDKPELFNVLAIALSQITPKERSQLAQKWLALEQADNSGKHWQWIFFFLVEASLLCLGISWYINNSARKKVKEILKAIAEKNEAKDLPLPDESR